MPFKSENFPRRRAFMMLLRSMILSLALPSISAMAQDAGNGIHVGDAKVYDERELTLMLDSLNQSIQGKNFIDQSKLAAALGNVQGFQNTDTSFSVFANGAVGPQAASVFANNLPASGASAATPPLTATPPSTSPTVSININPAGTATTPTAATTGGPTGFGPSLPTLPTLQAAPNFNPNFGPSGGDLLTDEVNLTYQMFNLSMLLSRSLTDRTYRDPSGTGHSRLHAVVGFDIDIEPDNHAKDAVAVVEVTASMSRCNPNPSTKKDCIKEADRPVVVAMMPEQGSHNAATLTQSANSFGGALAAQVFSAGVSAQKRSQTFYLYRDIDTLAMQEPEADPLSNALHFGWQFRPVLGRHTVDAGLRHMMAVLSLPAVDEAKEQEIKDGLAARYLDIHVKTHWVRYEGSTQTTTMHDGFFKHVPPRVQEFDQATLKVPMTGQYQADLEPHITEIEWLPTDGLNGVAVIKGRNFFLGTTVRIGNKPFTGKNDGLTLKSDTEIELALPLTAAVTGGVLSGRYGDAVPLVKDAFIPYKQQPLLRGIHAYPQGPDGAQIIAKMVILPPDLPGTTKVVCRKNDLGEMLTTDEKGTPLALDDGRPANLASLPQVNPGDIGENPLMLINGVPVTVPPIVEWNRGIVDSCTKEGYPPGSRYLDVTAFVSAKDIMKGSALVTVAFPLRGLDWVSSGFYYQKALNIVRAGSSTNAKLIITSNDPGDCLCDGWSVQLDQCEIPLTPDSGAGPICSAPQKPDPAKPPSAIAPTLRCIDAVGKSKVSLDIDATQLKGYRQLLMVHRPGAVRSTCGKQPAATSSKPVTLAVDDTRLGAIPEAKPKPAQPTVTKGPIPASVQQYSSQTIELDGTDLDQIKTVLFDKTPLKIVNQDSGSLIVSIPPIMTKHPAVHDQIQLIPAEGDPVLVTLDVTANPSAPKLIATTKEK